MRSSPRVCTLVLFYLPFISLDLIDDTYIHTDRLPYSIRVLLESGIRNCDGFQITSQDVSNLLDWNQNQDKKIEIPFRPARVILQDFTWVFTYCTYIHT